MKTHHNYVFIQILQKKNYKVIQTSSFFFLEKSSRILWAK